MAAAFILVKVPWWYGKLMYSGVNARVHARNYENITEHAVTSRCCLAVEPRQAEPASNQFIFKCSNMVATWVT